MKEAATPILNTPVNINNILPFYVVLFVREGGVVI